MSQHCSSPSYSIQPFWDGNKGIQSANGQSLCGCTVLQIPGLCPPITQDSTHIFSHLCSAAVLPSLILIIMMDFVSPCRTKLYPKYSLSSRSLNGHRVSMHKDHNWNKKNTISLLISFQQLSPAS